MSAYFIISYDIVDPDTFQAYPPKVLDFVTKHGGEILVSDMEAEALEGTRNTMHAIVRFPSKEVARECFNGDEYQKTIKPIRMRSTKNAQIILAQGIDRELPG